MPRPQRAQGLYNAMVAGEVAWNEVLDFRLLVRAGNIEAGNFVLWILPLHDRVSDQPLAAAPLGRRPAAAHGRRRVRQPRSPQAPAAHRGRLSPRRRRRLRHRPRRPRQVRHRSLRCRRRELIRRRQARLPAGPASRLTPSWLFHGFRLPTEQAGRPDGSPVRAYGTADAPVSAGIVPPRPQSIPFGRPMD